jgi:hypothetical protein
MAVVRQVECADYRRTFALGEAMQSETGSLTEKCGL